MNKEIKKKWIEALRSGRYKQGQARLRSVNDEFCCLGVLLDVLGEGKWEESNYGKYYEINLQDHVLDLVVREKVGLKDDDHRTLMVKNDRGYSFNEIADWIEKNL